MKKTFFQKLAQLFESEKFKTAQLADADQTEVSYEGDAIAVGVILTMKTTDDTGAENVIPLPEGEHPLGGEYAGKIAVVDATGKVTELKDAQAAAGAAAAGATPTPEQQEEALAKLLFDRLTKVEKEFAAFKKSVVDGKVEKGKFVFNGQATKDKISKLL